MNTKKNNEPDFLDYLRAIIEIEAKSEAISEKTALSLAKKITMRTSDEWGGIRTYIHKSLSINERDKQIFKEFTGSNSCRLALKYKISERQIYAIAEKVRTAETKKRQQDLLTAKT